MYNHCYVEQYKTLPVCFETEGINTTCGTESRRVWGGLRCKQDVTPSPAPPSPPFPHPVPPLLPQLLPINPLRHTPWQLSFECILIAVWDNGHAQTVSNQCSPNVVVFPRTCHCCQQKKRNLQMGEIDKIDSLMIGCYKIQSCAPDGL